MYLILLIVVFATTGVFAFQNDGSQVFHLAGYSWSVATWIPTAIGVAAVSFLLLLRMSHANVGSHLREMGHYRTLDEHRGTIDDLRAENTRLREQLAGARGEVRGVTRTNGPAQRSWLDEIRDRVGIGDRTRTPTA